MVCLARREFTWGRLCARPWRTVILAIWEACLGAVVRGVGNAGPGPIYAVTAGSPTGAAGRVLHSAAASTISSVAAMAYFGHIGGRTFETRPITWLRTSAKIASSNGSRRK